MKHRAACLHLSRIRGQPTGARGGQDLRFIINFAIKVNV